MFTEIHTLDIQIFSKKFSHSLFRNLKVYVKELTTYVPTITRGEYLINTFMNNSSFKIYTGTLKMYF